MGPEAGGGVPLQGSRADDFWLEPRGARERCLPNSAAFLKKQVSLCCTCSKKGLLMLAEEILGTTNATKTKEPPRGTFVYRRWHRGENN